MLPLFAEINWSTHTTTLLFTRSHPHDKLRKRPDTSGFIRPEEDQVVLCAHVLAYNTLLRTLFEIALKLTSEMKSRGLGFHPETPGCTSVAARSSRYSGYPHWRRRLEESDGNQ